mgnify:CR=1 FL=1
MGRLRHAHGTSQGTAWAPPGATLGTPEAPLRHPWIRPGHYQGTPKGPPGVSQPQGGPWKTVLKGPYLSTYGGGRKS